MPFIPVPSTAMVELFYTQDGQKMENTLYFGQAEAYDAAELTTLATEVRDWAIEFLLPQMASAVVMTGVKATSLESDTAPAIEITGGGPGGVAGAALPNNVALVVKFLTAARGRSGRGRNYFPGLTEANVVANTVDASVANAIVDAYEQLLEAGTITEGAWVVVSRFEDLAPRDPGISQLVTSVALTDRIVDSQRRRLPGRGT
jgi:hypothetical protein